jgi:hypothetical protein
MCPQNEREMLATLVSLNLDGTDPRHYDLAFRTLERQGRLVTAESQHPVSTGLSETRQVRRPAPQPQDDESLRRQLDSMSLEDARRFLLERMQQR